jgi:hypothetical protein
VTGYQDWAAKKYLEQVDVLPTVRIVYTVRVVHRVGYVCWHLTLVGYLAGATSSGVKLNDRQPVTIQQSDRRSEPSSLGYALWSDQSAPARYRRSHVLGSVSKGSEFAGRAGIALFIYTSPWRIPRWDRPDPH